MLLVARLEDCRTKLTTPPVEQNPINLGNLHLKLFLNDDDLRHYSLVVSPVLLNLSKINLHKSLALQDVEWKWSCQD